MDEMDESVIKMRYGPAEQRNTRHIRWDATRHAWIETTVSPNATVTVVVASTHDDPEGYLPVADPSTASNGDR
jgi:hypothetical protein